jgi:hypothetical protein
VLWLEIISGTGANTTCIADVSWKTNFPDHNPPEQNTALTITNPVLAGTWTLKFLSDTNGTLTAPGNVNVNVPFTLGSLADADAIAAFSPPVQVRFGHENYGNAANGGVPHYWANIIVSNAASGLNINEDFTKEGTNQLDTTIWDLNTSDGVGNINLVPTNAPYWVRWTTSDTGFTLVTATNLTNTNSWQLPEFYNNYADGTNTVATQVTQGGQRWVMMLPWYLPTANGLPGGPLAPYAFFRLTTEPPPGP